MFEMVWKNIWPDLSKGDDTTHSVVDMNELVELVRQTGLDEVNVQDFKEILQERVESLFSDELKELPHQEEHKHIESRNSEEEHKELSTACLFSHYNRNYGPIN